MGFLNSFALKRMAKEHLVAWCKQSGLGHPPAAATDAMGDAAAALDGGSEIALNSALDRYVAAVRSDSLLVSMGVATMLKLTMEFPQYEWATSCIEKWNQRRPG